MLLHLLTGLALRLAGSATLPAQAERPIAVSYLSANAVYVDAGRAEGLAAGARLRVVRGGTNVAELEVDYVAEHSASCRVVVQLETISPGDRVIVLAGPGPEAATPGTPPPPPAAPEPETPTPLRLSVEPRRQEVPWARTSGSLAFSYRTFEDDLGPSANESTGRVSLRLRELGGHPLELRLRARSREIARDGYGPSVAESQSSDRLYELSLAYAPPAGRVHAYLGRLGAGPFPALGDLDGLLAEVRLGGGFWFGAFGGSRPELAELGYETAGEKYGGFFRFAHDPPGRRGYAEVLLGGVVENDDAGETSREYVAVESRFGSGSSWWLSQRAEIDLNRGWRERVAGSSSQVSQASLAASFTISPRLRARLSYDQRRNLLTAESRPRPEEVFTRYLREGARAGLEWRSPSGWSGSLGVGSERADTIDDPTDSLFLTVDRANLWGGRLLLGGDATVYSGGTAEGWVTSLRTRFAFRGGHDVGLTFGASEAELGGEFALSPRSNQWARLSATVQLPARLWLYGEYEIDAGDDFEGDRAVLEVGYRF